MLTFTQMLASAKPQRTALAPRLNSNRAGGDTRTAQLLRLIEAGPKSTRQLSDATGISSNLVWGLLKVSKNIGEVAFDDGRWSLCANFPGADVVRAAALLREKGWLVEPPEEVTEETNHGR